MKRTLAALALLALLVTLVLSLTGSSHASPGVVCDPTTCGGGGGGASDRCNDANLGSIVYMTTSRLAANIGSGYYHFWRCNYDAGDYNARAVWDTFHQAYFRDPGYVWWVPYHTGYVVGSNINDTTGWPQYEWELV